VTTKTDVALDAVSVVVKGQFNAAIFSPAWMLHENIIGTPEYAKAQVEIVTRDFASFSADWLQCQVTPDTFQVSTTEPDEFERVRDVAVGVLTTLSHTPVAAVGINRDRHFASRNRDQYHAIGDELVPKEFWESLLRLPVTRSVVIWGERPDKYGGRVQIQVEPSFRFLGHVALAHNDHFDLQIVEKQATTRDEAWTMSLESPSQVEASAGNIPIVTEILTSEWVASMNRSDDVMHALMRI
jgi:hypothetical protein